MKICTKSGNLVVLFGMRAATLTVTLLLVFGGVGRLDAAYVAVFDNGSYVDTDGGTEDESDTIQASLASLGHTVTTFTGISAPDWTSAGASADLILIPELRADLCSALTSSCRSAIAGYVGSGGGLVLIGTNTDQDAQFLNDVFGYSVSKGSGSGTFDLNASNASGTPFADDPASLSYNNHTEAIAISSLPAEVLTIYANGIDTVVWVAGIGSGRIGYLGWDWYDAVPMGTLDGGWNSVLDSTVEYVPEPATLSLLTLGAIGLLRRRKVGSGRISA